MRSRVVNVVRAGGSGDDATLTPYYVVNVVRARRRAVRATLTTCATPRAGRVALLRAPATPSTSHALPPERLMRR